VNWIDLVLLGIFAWALHLGYQKGFVKQAATLAGLVLGIALAGRYHAELAQSTHLAPVMKQCGESTTLLITYLGVFVATILGALLAATIIGHAIKGKAAGSLDNLLGGLLGFAKIYVACGIVAVAAFQFLPPDSIRRHLTESYLAPRIAQTVTQALDHIPATYQDSVREFFRQGAPHPQVLDRAPTQIATCTGLPQIHAPTRQGGSAWRPVRS